MRHYVDGCPASQTLAATVIVSGPQLVKIDTHCRGGRGSYISLSTPHVMVTVHDTRVMQTYATIWADTKGDATFLPAQRPVDIEKLAHVMPGLVITAYGKDQTRGPQRAKHEPGPTATNAVTAVPKGWSHVVGITFVVEGPGGQVEGPGGLGSLANPGAVVKSWTQADTQRARRI